MQEQGWYQQLQKPSWAPHESVFGQVWSVLYPVIFSINIYVLALIVTRRQPWTIGVPFWINLIANLAFTPLQFGLRSNVLALLDIIIVLLTIIWCIVVMYGINKWVAVALVPYLVWVSIATALQASITYLNR